MGTASTLYDLASRRFLVLEPDWTVGKVLDLLVSLEPEYALLLAQDDEERGSPSFHGATEVELELHLTRQPADEILRQIPDLTRHLDLLPACDAYLPVHRAPEYCVVIDEGDVVGIWDADRNPGPWRSGEDGAHRLEVDHEPEVELGAELSLFVSLETDDFPAPDSEDLDVPVGSEIEIWVRPKRGFQLTGPRNVRLRVEESGQDGDGAPSAAATFRLQAIELGVGRVEVHALFEGQHLGRLVVAPRVHASGEAVPNPLGSSFRAETTTATRLWQVPEDRPDLTLTILEANVEDKTELEFRFHVKGSEVESFGPFPMAQDPHPHLRRLFADLEDGGGFRAETDVRRRLNQTGAYLFETLFPGPLRGRIWSLRDRLRTVQVVSDEATLPWELCLLWGEVDGKIREDELFCERFAISRWWSGGPSPTRELRLGKIGLLIPEGSGLPHAPEERKALRKLMERGHEVEDVPVQYTPCLGALSRGTYQALHFAGHGFGETGVGDTALLELGEGALRTWDISGIVSQVGIPRPLVFFNACKAGHAGRALEGLSGWAIRFLKVGAGAFVGTLWSIRDHSSQVFAEAFYDALLENETIGEATRRARCRVRDQYPDKTTWLAYTVFADPLAKVVRTEPKNPHSTQGLRVRATSIYSTS